jgi:serine protease Do
MMGNGNADPRPGACARRTRTGLFAFLLACAAGLGFAAGEVTTSAEIVPPESPAMAARPHAGMPAGFADLVAKVRPSVISIRVKIENSAVQSGDNEADDAAPPQHYAVTHNHVVDNAESVAVTTSDGTIYAIYSPSGARWCGGS